MLSSKRSLICAVSRPDLPLKKVEGSSAFLPVANAGMCRHSGSDRRFDVRRLLA